MVLGIGTDIVDIDRIGRLVERYGDSFTRKVFTEREREYCESMARPAVHYAGRFAVKEAYYKALPASCQPQGRWKSIETVSSSNSGHPRVVVVDGALQESLNAADVGTTWVSISHERSVCVALVVLEKAN